MDLYHWKAKRAGGRITVYGRTALRDGDQTKVVGVDLIEPPEGLYRTPRQYVIALDKAGTPHRLFI